MTATRTFKRVKANTYLPGLGDQADVEVTGFHSGPERFVVEGSPATDDFFVEGGAWLRLGKPERIKVTVEPA